MPSTYVTADDTTESVEPADTVRDVRDESTHAPASLEAQPWQEALPMDAGPVVDITKAAAWSLSSCKSGSGIQELLHNHVDHYWQSDGPQPHFVTMEFPQKTDICFLMLFLDYRTDESYTPNEVIIQHGSSILDLHGDLTRTFNEPTGWQVIDLRNDEKYPTRAWVLQLQIVKNHQNGRDTHIRQIRVIGPKYDRATYVHRCKLLQPVDANGGILRLRTVNSNPLPSYLTLR